MCLKRGLVVIIEGILKAKRYGAMLELLSRANARSLTPSKRSILRR